MHKFRKSILAVALSLTVAGGAYAAIPATAQNDEPQMETTIVVNEVTEVLEAPAADSSQLPGSEIARKMTQAEKAHNAAVNDSWGGAITIIAMFIVISALAILSLLFLGFGKISQSLLAKNKREANSQTAEHHEEHHAVDSGDVIAAIAAALSEHFGEGHDMEDTILTIRKLQKAYSPWSSKIYHLRQVPEHRRNLPGQASI